MEGVNVQPDRMASNHRPRRFVSDEAIHKPLRSIPLSYVSGCNYRAQDVGDPYRMSTSMREPATKV